MAPQERARPCPRSAGEKQSPIPCEGGELTLVVADDGHGFDPKAPDRDGSGLRGMRDRVELFGGRIDIGSRPSLGTRISARVQCTASGEGGQQ